MTVSPTADGDLSEPQTILGALLQLPASERPAKDIVDRLGGLVRAGDADDIRRQLQSCPPDALADIRAAVRIADLATGAGFLPGGLTLIASLVETFGPDERLIDFKLRHQLALGMMDALLDEARDALDRGIVTIGLAYRVVLSVNRAARDDKFSDADLHARAFERFMAVGDASPEKELWLGRYYRELGSPIVSIRHYERFVDQAAGANRFRPVALREGAELALAGDQWGRDAPMLLRAWREDADFAAARKSVAAAEAFAWVGAGAGLDQSANLPRTSVYSQIYAAVSSPEIAFDYLIDRVLPDVRHYEPQNTLLMVGTSLAGGGMERIFANSFKAVAASGTFERVRMALLNFVADSPTSFYLPETGASAEDIRVLENEGSPDLPISLLPLGLARRVSSAFELVKRERPRVIHAWNDLPGIVAAFAGLLAGCPRIFIHFHHMRAINLSDDRNLVRSYPACYRRLLERPEIELLFVADACADDYAEWWSVRRTSKFRRLYNGFVDLQAGEGARSGMRRDLGLGEQTPVVGTVFRFDRVKRPWLWVDVARHVKQRLPDARFVMVGGGAEMERTKARVGDYGLAEDFHFAGQVRNVPDYLACFDVFVLTSRIEGLPNSLVEAQLAGVPVVSTDVGGARETFIPGVTGEMVSNASPQALGDAVVRLLSDRDWRERAAIKSRQSALDRFSIGRYLKSLMAIYGENP